jgi:hypothetical protein
MNDDTVLPVHTTDSSLKQEANMKVLKHGRPQAGWSKKFTCTGAGNRGGGCGARLLVSEYDLYTTTSSHYDGSVEHYTTFCCCECGVETDIKSCPVCPKGKRPTEADRKAYALKNHSDAS